MSVQQELVSDYSSYLRLPELLELQSPLSRPVHPDELHFITTHQAIELWFGLLAHEVRRAREEIAGHAWSAGADAIRKATGVVGAIRAQLDTLRQMPAASFLAFRPFLGTASGLQSSQFRVLEVLSGLRDPEYLDGLRRLGRGTLPPGVPAALAEPSLPEAHRKAFEQAGVTDWAGLYELKSGTAEMRSLCEALIEYDEAWYLWRVGHLMLVERMMGSSVRGTGGTTAVYLERTLRRRFFPYLWDARSELAVFSGGSYVAEQPGAAGQSRTAGQSRAAEQQRIAEQPRSQSC